MKVQKNTIVSLKYRLTDAQDNLIEESAGPMIYLHGGYDGTFPKIEEAVDGHDVGYETTIQTLLLKASYRHRQEVAQRLMLQGLMALTPT